jgi:hypothetical protein
MGSGGICGVGLTPSALASLATKPQPRLAVPEAAELLAPEATEALAGVYRFLVRLAEEETADGLDSSAVEKGVKRDYPTRNPS